MTIKYGCCETTICVLRERRGGSQNQRREQQSGNNLGDGIDGMGQVVLPLETTYSSSILSLLPFVLNTDKINTEGSRRRTDGWVQRCVLHKRDVVPTKE
jgi:hypothetical protein